MSICVSFSFSDLKSMVGKLEIRGRNSWWLWAVYQPMFWQVQKEGSLVDKQMQNKGGTWHKNTMGFLGLELLNNLKTYFACLLLWVSNVREKRNKFEIYIYIYSCYCKYFYVAIIHTVKRQGSSTSHDNYIGRNRSKYLHDSPFRQAAT